MMEQKDALSVAVQRGIQVGKYTVAPWTLGKLEQLTPALVDFRRVCATANVSLDALVTDPVTVLLTVLPSVTPILAVTLSVPPEEIRELEADEALAIAVAVLDQNLNYLLKLFGPTSILMSTLKTVAKLRKEA